MSGYIRLLRDNPNYARLWLAQCVSLLGDWFNTIVLSTLVTRYSNGSGIALSIFLLARFLPPLIVSPYAGVLVDRFDRKRLLIFSDLSRAVIVILFLLANTPDKLWLIYLLTTFQFAMSAIFEPGRNAILPSLVKQDDLLKANTLGNVTWSLMLAVGAIAGGLVQGIFGDAFALGVDAASFLISALFMMGIRMPSQPIEESAVSHTPVEATKEDKSKRTFGEALRYIAQNPFTAAVLLVKAGGSLGNIDALIVIYATQIFVVGQGGGGSIGILYSFFGIGALLGPAILNRFSDGTPRVLRRLIIVAYAWMMIAWLLYGAAPTMLLAGIALTLRGMGGSVYWTYSSVILQKTVPDHYLGRLFSVDMGGFYLSTVLSTVLTGVLLEINTLPIGAFFGANPNGVTSLLLLQLQQNGIRQVSFTWGLLSLIPLVLWSAAVYMMERHRRYETALASA
ncbi:MAG: MFS transporter [Burkholderiales bacterium]|nr:MFS transporter [Anaerolineae bacterium]